MTIDAIEDAVASAAVSQGYKASAESMTQAAIQLAGSTLANGLIVIPGKGSISPGDFVRDLRAQMPEGFTSLDAEPDKPTGHYTGLTGNYVAEIAASRSKPRFSEADLARFTGLTKEMMQERLRADQGK